MVERPFYHDQKDGKHGKYQCFFLLEASKVSQSHAICVVFGAFSPGNHVNTDGYELSSAQNHLYLRGFLEKRDIFSILRAMPPKTSIFTQFLHCCDMFFLDPTFVKALLLRCKDYSTPCKITLKELETSLHVSHVAPFAECPSEKGFMVAAP